MGSMPLRLPNFGQITEASPLSGGTHGTTWRVSLLDGRQLVVKAAEHAPSGLFLSEAEGLTAITATGTLATPGILHAGPGHLLLEALFPAPADDATFWEEAGRAVAALHANAGPAHGWHADNWLGMLPQHNPWCDDGHEFFARHRLLRFLEEPKARLALGSEMISALEKICSKLSELVPPMKPVLCHGDLWSGNFLATHDGRPAVADPAVAYTWAEVDISMMYCEQPPPERFFAAYHELHLPEPAWRGRMELLHLRELLSVLAHFGDFPELCVDTVARVRAVIATYS